MEENKNNLINPTNPTPQLKKRTFNEAEQNFGSYNVGLKKQKTKLSKETTTKVLEKIKDINTDLSLENMEQGELLTKNAGKSNYHLCKMGSGRWCGL